MPNHVISLHVMIHEGIGLENKLIVTALARNSSAVHAGETIYTSCYTVVALLFGSFALSWRVTSESLRYPP